VDASRSARPVCLGRAGGSTDEHPAGCGSTGPPTQISSSRLRSNRRVEMHHHRADVTERRVQDEAKRPSSLCLQSQYDSMAEVGSSSCGIDRSSRAQVNS